MRPIPPKMREELFKLPRVKKCAVSHLGGCYGRIEIDHVWIYASKQINELWSLLGLCSRHHRLKEGDSKVKIAIQKASLLLASEEDLAKYYRKDWSQIKQSLL